MLAALTVMLLAAGTSLAFDTEKAPRKYSIGEEVDVSVYRLVSRRTIATYDYYDPELPFCQPPKVTTAPTSPGSLVGSDHTSSAPYRVRFLEPVPCAVLRDCAQPQFDGVSTTQQQVLPRLLELEYRAQILVDGVPAVWLHQDPKAGTELQRGIGVPLGARGLDGALYLYNHLSFRIHYQDYANNTYFVTRVEAEPLSTASAECRIGRPLMVAAPRSAAPPAGAAEGAPVWTYSVTWVPEQAPVTPGAHSTRWKKFSPLVSGAEPDAYWFAAVNVTGSTAFLILITVLFATCAGPKYPALPSSRSSAASFSMDEDGGPSSPFLRPPQRPLLFSVLVGVGSQLLVAFAVVLLAILTGYVRADDLYGVLSAACVALDLAGGAAGYVARRLYALFRGKHPWLCTVAAAAATPSAFYLFNFALTFATIGTPAFNLSILWRASSIVFLSFPLSVLGSLVASCTADGSKKAPGGGGGGSSGGNSSSSGKAAQEWYAVPLFTIAMGALIPFAASYTQLYAMASALWTYGVHKLAEMCAWLAAAVYVVAPLTGLLTAAFGIVGKSPSWWWRSFLVCAASAGYLAAYFVVIYCFKLEFVDATSLVVYVLYCAVIIAAYSVATGAAGTLASLFLTMKLLKKRTVGTTL